MDHGRHEHGGFSSADVIDPKDALFFAGIRRGDRVLDIGCSVGDYSIAASRIVGDTGEVIGMDVHQESLRIFAERVIDRNIENIEIIEADATEGIPLGDSSMDVILLFNVLHGFVYNGESELPLSEIKRILCPGGRLAIVESRPGVEGKGPPDEVRIGRKSIEKLLFRKGFILLACSDISPYHDIFLFKVRPYPETIRWQER